VDAIVAGDMGAVVAGATRGAGVAGATRVTM